MLHNRLFIASLYLFMIICGFITNIIHIFYLLVFLSVWVTSKIAIKKVTYEPLSGYYRHLAKTSGICLCTGLGALPLLIGSIYINMQLNQFYPDHELIAQNPMQFMQLASSFELLFGLSFLGIILFVAYRSYVGLVAILKTQVVEEVNKQKQFKKAKGTGSKAKDNRKLSEKIKDKITIIKLMFYR